MNAIQWAILTASKMPADVKAEVAQRVRKAEDAEVEPRRKIAIGRRYPIRPKKSKPAPDPAKIAADGVLDAEAKEWLRERGFL